MGPPPSLDLGFFSDHRFFFFSDHCTMVDLA